MLSLLEWYGMIFVRNGHYTGGVFPFKVLIPEDFPSAQPPVIPTSPILFLFRKYYYLEDSITPM